MIEMPDQYFILRFMVQGEQNLFKEYLNCLCEEKYGDALKILKNIFQDSVNTQLQDEINNTYKNLNNYTEEELFFNTKVAFCEQKKFLLYSFATLTLSKNPNNSEIFYLLASQQLEYNENYDAALFIIDKIGNKIRDNAEYISFYAKCILEKLDNEQIEGEERNNLLEKVLNAYKNAITLEPDNAVYRIKIARFYGDFEKNYQAAIDAYSKAIELDPDNSWFYSERADMKIKLENIDGAIEDYEKCLELDKFSLTAYIELAELWRRKNQNSYVIVRLNRAIEDFGDISNFKQALSLVIAQHYKIIGDFDNFKAACTKILTEFPNDSQTLYLLFEFYKENNMYDEILDLSNKVIQTADDYIGWTYRYRLCALCSLGKYQETLDFIEKSSVYFKQNKKHLSDFILYNNYKYKGDALLGLNRYEEAIKAYEKALKYDDEKEYGEYFYIALCFEYMKKYRSAIRYYKKYIEVYPENFDSYFNISLCLFDLKQYKKAYEYLEKGKTLNPGYSDIHLLTALLDFELKHIDKSIKTLSELISKTPENLKYYYIRGEEYFLIGEYDKSLSDLNTIVEMLETNDIPDTAKTSTYYLRGMVNEKLGDEAAAKEDYSKALQIYPEFNAKEFVEELYS